MDYLRTFAEEYGLRDVVNSLSERRNVQGAILRLDDLWLQTWRWFEAGRGDEWERWVRSWRYWGPSPVLHDRIINAPLTQEHSWIPRRTPDLSWRPPNWDEFSAMTGRNDEIPPIHLIVCLRPPAAGETVVLPELPRARLSVRFEVRPVARLSASQRTRIRPVVGGISVGTGSSIYATLGGVAEDKHTQRYGMTCAHAFLSTMPIDQPALRDDLNATTIGKNTSSITLQSCPGSGPCNPYTNSPHITSVDTTLIELGPAIASDLEILSIGPLAGVVAKNSMTVGQEVEFEGRTSGHRVAEVGGLAVFYRFAMGGQSYCFKDLFEVRWQSFIRACFGPIARPGDSGAWVCAETDQGPAWCGQIVGESRHVAYAAFAENIISEWSNAGHDLSVV